MDIIHLSSLDNTVVLARSVQAGDRIKISGTEVVMEKSLCLGHKLALQKIDLGEKILKYGVSIGSATCGIEAGEHVHLHNMKSDYLPTYTLEKGREFHTAS